MGLPDVPPGLERQADDALAAVAADVYTVQAVELTARGKYWQGLKSPATTPSNGDKGNHDGGRKPSDGRSWNAAGVSLPAKSVIAVEVHEYVGPSCVGYTVIGTIDVGQTVFQKAIHTGSETYRDGLLADWTDVTPEDVP